MTLDWLYAACGPNDDAQKYAALAQELETKGEMGAAATAYDRAFGLAPDNAAVAEARRRLLDQLSVVEHGILFRYIPAGSFLMGSETGDPDERPVHPVALGEYWLAETPVSWDTFCQLMGWEPPPVGVPPDEEKGVDSLADADAKKRFYWHLGSRQIRLQYCEDETTRARDWHAHDPNQIWTQAGEQVTARHIFGEVPREHPELPWRYSEKPVVAIASEEALTLCEHISTPQIAYRLPTEAEWEKAARGGLIGTLYPWGNDPPTHDLSDFDRFEQASLRKMRAFPPNAYGLYAMSGGVWEWTADWYDADYYKNSPRTNPTGPAEGQEKVLRGGSWADCAEALRVSFRMSSRDACSPTIGFRLCRVRQATQSQSVSS